MGFTDSIKKVIGIEELDDDEMITEEEVNAAKEKIAKEPRHSFSEPPVMERNGDVFQSAGKEILCNGNQCI